MIANESRHIIILVIESESKKSFLQGENKLLREKITELNKRIQSLENKAFSTSTDLTKDGNFIYIYLLSDITHNI